MTYTYKVVKLEQIEDKNTLTGFKQGKMIGYNEYEIDIDIIKQVNESTKDEEAETTIVSEKVLDRTLCSTSIRKDITKILKYVIAGADYKITYAEVNNNAIQTMNFNMPKKLISFRKGI